MPWTWRETRCYQGRSQIGLTGYRDRLTVAVGPESNSCCEDLVSKHVQHHPYPG
jgi:hypothetical protein